MDEPAPPPQRPPIRRSVVLGLFLGLLTGVVATLVVLRVARHDPTPELTLDAWNAARERWQAKGPENYNIEIRVTGTQPAVYRVEVREGQAVSATRNGKPLQQRRTFGTWSVPGMFGTMSRDVHHWQRQQAGKLEPQEPHLTLRAQFDPQYGYPARYRRIQWGSSVEVAWEVTAFEKK